jgi:hypothetical protein
MEQILVALKPFLPRGCLVARPDRLRLVSYPKGQGTSLRRTYSIQEEPNELEGNPKRSPEQDAREEVVCRHNKHHEASAYSHDEKR